MSDLPKQELDELFREGADMQTFDYNEAAWSKMEDKLDADDRNRKIGIWLLMFIGIALAVMAGFWYVSTEDNDLAQQDIIAQKENSNSSIENQNVQTEVIHINETEVVNSVTEDIGSEINNETENSIAVNLSNEKATQKQLVNSAIADNVTNGNNTDRGSHIFNPSINDTDREASENTIASSTSVDLINQIQSEAKRNALLQIEKLQQHNIARLTAYNGFLKNAQLLVDVSPANYDDNEASIASKLSYTIFAASEWSSIGMFGPRKMGYKFGANIGFQISDKLELSTGLSLSQKKFNGEGSHFTEASGWKDDIIPMTMEGKCNIIEIPLDVVYHFSGVGNTGFVASAGLRSYMLHSEWYGFEYDPMDMNPDLLEEKNMDNQNKNWLGSIELSMGYSKKISTNLSVQVAPYLQIPVTGFGDGKVNLYSCGVKFAARFDGK